MIIALFFPYEGGINELFYGGRSQQSEELVLFAPDLTRLRLRRATALSVNFTSHSANHRANS